MSAILVHALALPQPHLGHAAMDAGTSRIRPEDAPDKEDGPEVTRPGPSTCMNTCALGGTRTPNLLIRSQMLYPLSYERRHCSIPRPAPWLCSVHTAREALTKYLVAVKGPILSTRPGCAMH